MRLAASIEQSDEDLARRARTGAADAMASFEELVRRYQVPLMRFLQRRLSNQIEAEDVIQDAFLRAYQSIHAYRDGQPFKPWIYTIAYRAAIDTTRRRRPANFSMIESVSDPSEEGPLNQAVRRDSRNHLWNLVRRVLGDEAFTTVWLHYGEGMSTGDIAQITQRSQPWVKTTLLRARAKIKVALEPSGS